jgi:VWFA-related protein
MGGGGGYPGGGGGGWPGGGGRHPGGTNAPQLDGRKIMQDIASRTGGMFFEAKKKESLDDIYGLIAGALRQQYLLTYTPDRADTDGDFHKIALKTDKPELTIITREGYYATNGNEAAGD